MEKFYTARYDRIFRTIFINDNDYHLLEALLSTCVDKKVKIIKILKTELSINSSKEKVKRLDLIVETNGEKMNVELNTDFSDPIKVRNFNYFASFYSSNTAIGEKYDTETVFIHIDLSYGIKENSIPVNEYYIHSNITNDNYVDNFKIIVINMDAIMNFWYNKNKEEIKKYDLLMMLDMDKNNLNSLEKICNHKALINEFKSKVCKLNEDYDFIAPISAEEDYIMLMNTEKELAVEEGYKEGMEKGIEQGMEKGIEHGIEQGKLNERLQIIENMQKANFTKEQILQSLNISEDEYNDLIKELKRS